MEIIPGIIVHGGAGYVDQNRELPKKLGVKKAVQEGYRVLLGEGNVLDAVEAAIKTMEDDEHFNAGYGSALTKTGEVEMDAIIIEGSTLLTAAMNCVESNIHPTILKGGVGAVKHVKNPISLARKVMSTSHFLLVGSGAEEFARSSGMTMVPSSELISPRAVSTLSAILERSAKPTTETGGSGTVGDTPIVGGGTYCDSICGISATGLGEAIMRVCLSSRIANAIERGEDISEACGGALKYMAEKIPDSDGGAIVITKDGKIGYNFNSKKMSWAYIQGSSMHYGILKDEDIIEELP